MESNSSAVKSRNEKEDEVSLLLAALRALCTSAHTIQDGQQACAIDKLQLNVGSGALGIAVNYMYFNEVRRIGNIVFLIFSCSEALKQNYYSAV